MSAFNVYMVGVGGQGIGLLSECLTRAVHYSGQQVTGVDTHGLAQRGGMVVSQLRIGDQAHSPLIQKHNADLVIALERHEAYRGLVSYAKPQGTLLYYDAVWQPLMVRLHKEACMDNSRIQEAAKVKQVSIKKIFLEDLADARMQNVALLGALSVMAIVPNLHGEYIENALHDLLSQQLFDSNISVFKQAQQS